MQEQYEKFNKEIEAISNRNRNSKAEEYNERTKKNPTESFKSILNHAEEKIRKLKDRSFEISQLRNKKQKRKTSEESIQTYGSTLSRKCI